MARVKPRKKRRAAMYDYYECAHYIEKKYKVDLHGSIWGWLCDAGMVKNGGELHFDPKQILHEERMAKNEGPEALKEFYQYADKDVCDHCRLFVKEFPDAGDEPFWCEW